MQRHAAMSEVRTCARRGGTDADADRAADADAGAAAVEALARVGQCAPAAFGSPPAREVRW